MKTDMALVACWLGCVLILLAGPSFPAAMPVADSPFPDDDIPRLLILNQSEAQDYSRLAATGSIEYCLNKGIKRVFTDPERGLYSPFTEARDWIDNEGLPEPWVIARYRDRAFSMPLTTAEELLTALHWMMKDNDPVELPPAPQDPN